MPKVTKVFHKTATDIYAEVQQLNLEEREKLSLMLIQETDAFFATPEIEQAWIEEIARREQLFQAGELELIDADEVFREARKILAE